MASQRGAISDFKMKSFKAMKERTGKKRWHDFRSEIVSDVRGRNCGQCRAKVKVVNANERF